MFKTIENLPSGAVGFEAHGQVTDADRRTVLEPTIESLFFNQGDNSFTYFGIHHYLTAGFAIESRNGDAPGTLAGNAPVRPAFDHVADAVPSPGRNPAAGLFYAFDFG